MTIVIAERKPHSVCVEISDSASIHDLRIVSQDVNTRIKELRRKEKQDQGINETLPARRGVAQFVTPAWQQMSHPDPVATVRVWHTNCTLTK